MAVLGEHTECEERRKNPGKLKRIDSFKTQKNKKKQIKNKTTQPFMDSYRKRTPLSPQTLMVRSLLAV
jgi:hypothetical protein